MAEILVCDDDRDIVEAIEIYLTQEGHHILKAYDGEQAMRCQSSFYQQNQRMQTKFSD